MSPTLQKLCHFEQSSPANIDLQAAFSTSGLQLINALDNGQISFADDIDRSMLLVTKWMATLKTVASLPV